MEDESQHGHTSVVPVYLSYKLLKEITCDFAEDHKLGRGAFGAVYKGVLKDGKVIAVKMLRWLPEIDDKQFKNEFELLKKLKHQNIVQLVGFCNEVDKVLALHEGKQLIVEDIHRALCLEFVPNGSLGNFLNEQSLLLNWDMRFNMIKEICEGLRYLHKLGIMHLDLKPDNVLIDEKMLPKIADFGMSRLVGTANTIMTMTPQGTLGYIPPEFIEQQIISYKYDVFSMGVIIKKIVDSDIADMADKEFIEHVLEKWKKRFQEIPGYASLEVEVGMEQVRTCIEIAADCTKRDWRNRPTMDEIVYKLNEIETAVAARLRMTFKDDEKPPRNTQRIKGNSLSDLVTMKPMKYLKENTMLTADTLTVEVELNASTCTAVREKKDLVAVLDVSGSMARERIDNMKEAMKHLIMKLTPLDRFSIVAFSDNATRQCPLRCMTQSAQNDLKDILDGLDLATSLNRTNIKAGLETAMAILNGRVTKKDRAAKILVVSVRPQNDGDARLFNPGKVCVYTFGFHKDADDKLLYDIANKSPGGTFTSVLDGADMSVQFAELLGGFVPVAQDVRLTLTPQKDFGDLDKMVVAPATDYAQTTDRATGVINIKFGDFFSGDVRKVIVNLTLLPSNDTIDYNAVLALVQHSYAVQNVLRNGASQNINIIRTKNPVASGSKIRSDDDSFK